MPAAARRIEIPDYLSAARSNDEARCALQSTPPFAHSLTGEAPKTGLLARRALLRQIAALRQPAQRPWKMMS
jgi:hypothetical protein